MPLNDVDYIRESKRDEKARNVHLYDEDMRRQIDRMLTDHAVDYIKKWEERSAVLYVPFAFAHSVRCPSSR